MTQLEQRHTFRFGTETKLLIERLTKEEGISQSELMRQALELYNARSKNEELGEILGERVLGFEKYRKALEVQILEIERQSAITFELVKQLYEAAYGDIAASYIKQAEQAAIERIELPKSKFEAFARR